MATAMQARTELTGRISAFLRWWTAELAALLPDSLRAVLRPERRRLLVVVEDDEVQLVVAGPGGQRELGRLPLAGDPEQARRFDALLGHNLRGVEEVVLRLPPAAVIRKTVSLPLAAQENLREVLSFEMDRYTPFRADWVYYDHAVLERDVRMGRMVVLLTVVPRARLDPLLEALGALGLRPGSVDVAPADPDEPGPDVDLMPADRRGRGRRGARLVNRVLLALVGVLAAVAVAVPLVQRHAVVQDLREDLAAVRVEAEQALTLREQLRKSTAEGAFLVQRKGTEPSVVEVLDELTRLLPDDTWLYRLELEEGTVRMQGESSEAAMLISLIENAPMFSDTRFEAAITKNPQSGDDRFMLSTSLAGGVGR